MKIIVVSGVFPPEPVTSAITSGHLADELAGRGHKVQVIAPFPNRPAGKIYPSFRRAWCSTSNVNGYIIHRVWNTTSGNSGFISRFLENIVFGITSLIRLFFIEKPDIIYSNSWPIFATGFVALFCRIFKIPLILSVQDIYPESLIFQGKLAENGFGTKVLRKIDRAIVRIAHKVIVISAGFADFYIKKRKVSETKVQVIPNWLDEKEIKPVEKENSIFRRLGFKSSDFIALYAGNIGHAASVITVIEAATLLKANPNVKIVIAGSGTEKYACEKMCFKRGLDNVFFISPLLNEELNQVHGMADILLLPTLKNASVTSVPSKLIAYMLSAKPILGAVKPSSDSAFFIKEAECGFIVNPEEPEKLADEIARLSTGQFSDILTAMGKKARDYALNNFSKKNCLKKLVNTIENHSNEIV